MNVKVDQKHPVSLMRLPEVLERTGLSSSELYRRIARHAFPRPVKLGVRASAWSSAEIDEWINSRLASRKSGGADVH